MNVIACPKCQGHKWRATGVLTMSRRKLPRAELRCDRCGTRFTSGFPQAVDAASAERGECELPPDKPTPKPTFSAPAMAKIGAVSSPTLDEIKARLEALGARTA